MLSTSSTICSRTKSSQLILAMNEGFASIALSAVVEKAEYFKLLSKSATVWEDWGEFPQAKSCEEVSTQGGELVGLKSVSSSSNFNHPKFLMGK